MKNLSWLIALTVLVSGCIKTRAELEDQDEKKVMQNQVVNLQKAKADQENTYQNFDGQLRNMNGRVEVLEHKSELSERSNGEGEKRFALLEERIKALETAQLQTETELANLKKGKIAAEESASAAGGKKEKSLFEEADSQYQAKNWKRAAALYQKFRETSPKDKLVSIATLRIGLCFAELGMVKEARVFLEETIEKFPTTKSAKLAKFRLSELSKKKKND